jgi:hypothetical protein
VTEPQAEVSEIHIAVKLLFLLGFLLHCWYRCFEIGATSLADPDSCWLIAVGRWIVEHHGLPQTDPFSWTMQTEPNNYLPYQWLSSVIFYGLYSALGASSLLYFVCLCVLLSFIGMPFFLARKMRVTLFAQGVISAMAMSASSFHYFLRPEIFSYLFLSLLLFYVSVNLTRRASSPDVAAPAGGRPKRLSLSSFFISAGLGFLFFMLWANLHSGFVLGFLILATALIACMLASTSPGRPGRLAAFLGAGIVGSLCTPFGLRLYAYLPRLFFSPMNKVNRELQPLRLDELFTVNFQAFTLMQLVFVVSLVFLAWALWRNRVDAQKLLNPPPIAALICFTVLTAVAFVSGDLCRRMIPFAVLVSFPYFIFFAHACAAALKQAQYEPIGLRQFCAVLAGTLAFAVLGIVASIYQFPVTIPQTTPTFYVPDQAVQFIKRQRPPGHLLNDPQCGDVLILALHEDAKVFIDTRFDMYGIKIFEPLYIMANGLAGYENLLRDYQIDWVFFPPRTPLLARLRESPDWRTAFEDEAAVIMVRRQTSGDTTLK